MIKSILKIVLKLRYAFEKQIFKALAPNRWEELPDLDKWESVRELNPSAFDWKINSYKYKSDKFSGLLDNSHPLSKPQFFFKDLPFGRDCDNWSRVWVQYYLYHRFNCQEWLVTNKKHPFTKSHFVSVVEENNGFRLLNYKRYPLVHETVEEALDDLENWNNGDYNKDVRIQIMYKSYKAN